MKGKTMNAISCDKKLRKTFSMPYHIGVYLALNAVSDACLIVDGPNCSVPKAEFIYGNHDLFSTIFSPDGAHRLLYTMARPLKQTGNPDERLSVLLRAAADSGKFGIVLLTALPFLKLAGTDYEGLASETSCKTPVIEIAPKSLESGWLGGYSQALDSMVRAMPPKRIKRGKNTAAVVGYMHDRNEGDHEANIKELKRLAGFCGLNLTNIFPDGGTFEEQTGILGADIIISFPYGRKAGRRAAGISGARLLETDMPMGLRGTKSWMETLCRAAGTKPGEAAFAAEKDTAVKMEKAAEILLHKPAVFAGDPYLGSAFRSFAEELGMRPDTLIIDAEYTEPAAGLQPKRLYYAPDVNETAELIRGLKGFEKPAVFVGNSFAASENLRGDIPFVELGFPSYTSHCFGERPFLGFSGAADLAGRLMNSQLGSGRDRRNA